MGRVDLKTYLVKGVCLENHCSHNSYTCSRGNLEDNNAFSFLFQNLGCRASMINLEARSVKNWSSGRHCVVARLDHLTSTTLVKIKESAGALLIVLPRSPQHLSLEEVKVIELFDILEYNFSIFFY